MSTSRVKWSTLAEKLAFNIIIDDHALTIKSINNSTLMAKILLEQPWNKEENIGLKSIRAADWEEILQIIEQTCELHYRLHVKRV